MATFGQGINPQLGAIDYSPILRGSLAGAQMAAQGSQMIGQGLANLGQEVGKGVAAYYKKQEIKKLEDDGVAFIQNLGTKNPYILKAVGIKDPNDTKAIKAGMKAVGGVENFFKLANAAKGEMDKTQAADIAMRYGASGGPSSYMGADGETFGSPEANMMAQNQFMAQTTERLKQEKLKTEIALDKANAKKAGTSVLPAPQQGFRYAADGSGNQEYIPGGDQDPNNPNSSAARAIVKEERDAAAATRAEVAAKQTLIRDQRVEQEKAVAAENTFLKNKSNVATTLFNAQDYLNTLKDARAQLVNEAGGTVLGLAPVRNVTNIASGLFGVVSPDAEKYLSKAQNLNTTYDKLRGMGVVAMIQGFRANSPTGGNIFSGSQSDAEGKWLQDSAGVLNTSNSVPQQLKTIDEMIARAQKTLVDPLLGQQAEIDAEMAKRDISTRFNVRF